jgi:hypothetical protein
MIAEPQTFQQLFERIGRRLMRTFGWVKQLWPSFSRKL